MFFDITQQDFLMMLERDNNNFNSLGHYLYYSFVVNYENNIVNSLLCGMHQFVNYKHHI